MLAELHRLAPEPFLFLRTGATGDGVGDCLDYWIRSLRWANTAQPVPLTGEAEDWLLAHRPTGTSLSWGDSRLPNVIYRDYTPVGLLDWDLVSLAGPQADLAWWILMTPPESLQLEGIGSHDEFVDLWEDLTDMSASDLHWFLVFGAYRLAGILAKLFSMFVARGRMPSELADEQLRTGMHVQLLAGLLDLEPPAGVTRFVPEVRLDRR
jgi:aminoglycoside phosphotransferase (APT) family kinase protein